MKRCHLGVFQRGSKVHWEKGRKTYRGRIVSFSQEQFGPSALIDVLPYTSQTKRVTIPLVRLTKE